MSEERTPLTTDDYARFLDAYVECRFNFRAACRKIGKHYTTVYRHLRTNAEFQRAFAEVQTTLGDVALAEAVRRAIDGVEKPVFGSLGPGAGSGQIGTVTEYSDSLLRDILRATRREFRDTSHLEVTGPDGGPIEISNSELATKLTAILHAAKRRMLMGDTPDAIEGEIVDKPNLEDLV